MALGRKESSLPLLGPVTSVTASSPNSGTTGERRFLRLLTKCRPAGGGVPVQ